MPVLVQFRLYLVIPAAMVMVVEGFRKRSDSVVYHPPAAGDTHERPQRVNVHHAAGDEQGQLRFRVYFSFQIHRPEPALYQRVLAEI